MSGTRSTTAPLGSELKVQHSCQFHRLSCCLPRETYPTKDTFFRGPYASTRCCVLAQRISYPSAIARFAEYLTTKSLTECCTLAIRQGAGKNVCTGMRADRPQRQRWGDQGQGPVHRIFNERGVVTGLVSGVTCNTGNLQVVLLLQPQYTTYIGSAGGVSPFIYGISPQDPGLSPQMIRILESGAV